MSLYDAQVVLRQYFITNFDETIPVCFENRDDFWLCTETSLTPTEKPSDAIWVRFYFTNNRSDQTSYGSEGNRNINRKGLINFQIFAPDGEGKQDAAYVCESIINMFELKRFNTTHCYTGTYDGSGIQDDGFYMFVGTIFFDYDTHK